MNHLTGGMARDGMAPLCCGCSFTVVDWASMSAGDLEKLDLACNPLFFVFLFLHLNKMNVSQYFLLKYRLITTLLLNCYRNYDDPLLPTTVCLIKVLVKKIQCSKASPTTDRACKICPDVNYSQA